MELKHYNNGSKIIESRSTLTSKYHLLINNTKESFQIKIGNETVSNSKYEKLLGVKVDNELNFNEYVSLLCKKARQKLNPFSILNSILHDI